MKETGILGIILLAATTPENLLLWGLLLIVCIRMYVVADKKESAPQDGRPARRG